MTLKQRKCLSPRFYTTVLPRFILFDIYLRTLLPDNKLYSGRAKNILFLKTLVLKIRNPVLDLPGNFVTNVKQINSQSDLI